MNSIKYICIIPGFCKMFESYEQAWKYTQEYFKNTGSWLCVETVTVQ